MIVLDGNILKQNKRIGQSYKYLLFSISLLFSVFSGGTRRISVQSFQPLSSSSLLLSSSSIIRITTSTNQRKQERLRLLSSMEDILDGKILGDNEREIKIFQERYTRIPMYSRSGYQLRISARSPKVCYVLGPSGCGKTFFALSGLTREYVIQEKSVTVHLSATDFPSGLDKYDLASEIATKTKRLLITGAKQTKDISSFETLKMHVNLIIDDAGTEQFYDEYTNVADLSDILWQKFSTTLHLIIIGSGVIEQNLNSQPKVRRYRLLPWEEKDLETIIDRHFKNEISDTVLRFLKNEPILSALITNARSAWFLCEELKRLDIKLDQLANPHRKEQLLNIQSYKFVSDVVEAVAEKYIAVLGLSGNKQRRNVAALVFSVVERAVQEPVLTEPDFSSSYKDVRRVARALVNFNIQLLNRQYICETKQKESVTLCPAITLLLYYMLGAFIENVMDWQGQEMIAALRAFRLLAIEKRLDDPVLQKIQIVSLVKRVPEPEATTHFEIPIFDAPTVWKNGHNSPFADVIAPFCLYQCKYADSGGTVEFDLDTELGNCGLLTKEKDDSFRTRFGRAVVTALMETWKNKICFSPPTIDHDNEMRHSFPCIGHYPEQLIRDTRQSTDIDKQFIQFMYTEDDDVVTLPNGKQIGISLDFDVVVAYVISTDAKKLILNYKVANVDKTFTVTPDSVDNEGKLLADVKNQREWQDLLPKLRTNVDIRFVFG